MTKQEMVKKLVEHSVAAALREPDGIWLREIFERGTAGFANLPRAALRLEMELRGLLEFREPEALDDGHDDLSALLDGIRNGRVGLRDENFNFA